MNRFNTLFYAVALVFAVTFLTAAGSHPFRGNWKGTNSDGNKLTLAFNELSLSGGRIYEIQGTDDMGGEGGGSAAKMRGIGVLESEAAMTASCVWWSTPSGDPAFYFLTGTYSYDSDSDQVIDPEGVIYDRES